MNRVFQHPAFRGRLGVAQRDVTPPAGIHSRNWGASRHDTAEAIHRPFHLTVVTVEAEAGGEPFALVSLDLGWWRSQHELDVLSEAVRAAGVAEGHFLIALSHTHAGPIFCPALAEKGGGEWIEPYLRAIAAHLRDAVRDALQNARPGVWETSTGSCGVAANRDLPDPDGDRLLVGWNPDIAADATLLLGRLSDADGRVLATIVNYACHPTILAWENRHLSPDFVGAMREVVEAATQAPCLFLQGASGELAPREQYVGDPAVADRAGQAVGHAALGIFFSMLRPGHELAFTGALESGAPLALWRSRPRMDWPTEASIREVAVEVALRGDLPTAAALRTQVEACGDHVLRERLQRNLMRRELVGDGATVTRRHHLCRFGDILVVSVPDEAFSELQLTLRADAGRLPVFVSTLTNGTNGYLSPRHSFAAGSYASTASLYAEGCFETTLPALRAGLQSLL